MPQYNNGHYWNGKKQPQDMIIKRIQKGKKHYNYKDGRCLKQYYCIDCGVEISSNSGFRGNGRCHKCDNINKKGKSFFSQTQFKKGQHPWNYGLTKKTDKRVQKQAQKITGKNNGVFSNPTLNKHFKAGKYNNIYFRSSYEMAYAKYLDSKNIKWKYEEITFNLGYTTYIPDFYLPKINEYIEIKGFWFGDSKNKFKLFKKLYPKIQIKVLYQKDLQKLNVLI